MASNLCHLSRVTNLVFNINFTKKIMKKYFILSLLCASLTTSIANAKEGVYVGANAILSQATYKFSNPTASAPQGRVAGKDVGVGAYVGYKKSFNQVFLAPEIFYDYLNSSSQNYYRTSGTSKQDTLEIRSRYGAKANLGYDFSECFSAYLTYGLAILDQVNNYPSVKVSNGKNKTAAIYGLGGQLKINDQWSARAEFNSQRFNVPFSVVAGSDSKVRLNTLNIGAVYNF